MAGTTQRLSKAASELLQLVRAEGSVGPLLAELESEFCEFEMIDEKGGSGGGAMSDAAKRRLVDHEEPAPTRQMPLPTHAPGVKGSYRSKGSSMAKTLPEGIESLEQWGKTIIETGKYGKQDLSYAELAQSPDTTKVKYVQWLTAQGSRSDLSPLMQDLTSYLAMYHEQGSEAGPMFPGSAVTRKFKA